MKIIQIVVTPESEDSFRHLTVLTADGRIFDTRTNGTNKLGDEWTEISLPPYKEAKPARKWHVRKSSIGYSVYEGGRMVGSGFTSMAGANLFIDQESANLG